MSPPPPDAKDANGAVARFIELLDASLAGDDFIKLVLAKYHGPEAQLNQLVVRRVVLRGQPCLSLVSRYATRDTTKNLPVAQGLQAVAALLGPVFRNAHLMTRSEEIQLVVSKRGQATLHRKAAAHTAPTSQEHDREKRRFVDVERPFLVALGVTTPERQVIPAMARKWKQINKFVEVFSHALDSSPLAHAPRIKVVDFGSGKGYLTFAVHDHLASRPGLGVSVTGVELRADLVALCNAAASRLGLTGLDFEQGDVAHWAPQAIDVMIALHACDTATDHAIALGVRGGAGIILCAPCCHKEVRPQLMSPHPLRAILRHGVHLGQEADMLTDSLRALLLDACGYATQVFEFVSLEHTSKNKMILAVRRGEPGPSGPALEQVAELKRFYGIREQCLEHLLRAARPDLGWAEVAAP